MDKNDGAASLVRSDALLESESPLSNAELAEAIDRAHDSAGEHSSVQRLWRDHLAALQAIQRDRAMIVCDSNDQNDRFQEGRLRPF